MRVVVVGADMLPNRVFSAVRSLDRRLTRCYGCCLRKGAQAWRSTFEKVIYEKRGRIADHHDEPARAHERDRPADLGGDARGVVRLPRRRRTLGGILTGAGERAFSAGNDLVAMSQMQQQGSNAVSAAYSRAPFGGITRGFECWKPIIAAINGHCLAGGLEIALSCDMRIAAEHATFGLPEVTRAIIPGAGGTQRLPRAIPFGLALELILTGGRFDVHWAYRYGLVNHVVPADQVMPKAIAMAEEICENGPLAVRLAKEAAVRGAACRSRKDCGWRSSSPARCWLPRTRARARSPSRRNASPSTRAGDDSRLSTRARLASASGGLRTDKTRCRTLAPRT